MQYMECILLLVGLYHRFNYMFLRCSIDNEVEYTLEHPSGCVGRPLVLVYLFVIDPLSAMEGDVHVLPSYLPLQSFTQQLSWPYHRLYFNRFIRSNGVI